MVVGTGLIAKAFERYQKDTFVCVFASGVSNSLEQRESQFEREKELLRKELIENSQSLFVYFSTCSVLDNSVKHRPYVAHKLAMEELVREYANRYLICRLSHVVGAGGNKNTIVNFLVEALKESKKIEVWTDAERNILDVEDVELLVSNLIREKKENITVNIANPINIDMLTLVQQVETYLGKEAVFKSVPKGDALSIDTSHMIADDNLIARLKSDAYFPSILAKYFDV